MPATNSSPLWQPNAAPIPPASGARLHLLTRPRLYPRRTLQRWLRRKATHLFDALVFALLVAALAFLMIY
ncbi:hypothetical protein ACFQBQ_18560 [Granulicella cerasi]|uniref:Uncharacterized protein n=1 Tax=Granulicella cerasi TaxID=741063 RepID=A0ABW1ZDI1_9BACT|nr:hypothetical protein [Granulicella cerasi]